MQTVNQKPANSTLARATAVRARFQNPQAANRARLASITTRFQIRTGAQMLAEQADETAPAEIEQFDTGTTPAALETIEAEARAFEYRAEVAQAKIERAALLAHKAAVSHSRLMAQRAGGGEMAARWRRDGGAPEC